MEQEMGWLIVWYTRRHVVCKDQGSGEEGVKVYCARFQQVNKTVSGSVVAEVASPCPVVTKSWSIQDHQAKQPDAGACQEKSQVKIGIHTGLPMGR